MSLRQRLQEISNAEDLRDALDQAKAKEITDHIEENLIALAKQGKCGGVVYRTDLTKPDFPKVSYGRAGNYRCAWRDKVITEADVKRAMYGVFKKVFEFCVAEELSPTINQWDDDGYTEGFEIIVHW